MGLDSFYPPDIPASTVGAVVGSGARFLAELPPDLARKVGLLNAVRLYNLGRRLICHGTRTVWIDASGLAGHLAHGDHVGHASQLARTLSTVR